MGAGGGGRVRRVCVNVLNGVTKKKCCRITPQSLLNAERSFRSDGMLYSVTLSASLFCAPTLGWIGSYCGTSCDTSLFISYECDKDIIIHLTFHFQQATKSTVSICFLLPHPTIANNLTTLVHLLFSCLRFLLSNIQGPESSFPTIWVRNTVCHAQMEIFSTVLSRLSSQNPTWENLFRNGNELYWFSLCYSSWPGNQYLSTGQGPLHFHLWSPRTLGSMGLCYLMPVLRTQNKELK